MTLSLKSISAVDVQNVDQERCLLTVSNPLALLRCELLLEALGHLGRWRPGECECHLDTIVDEPLERGERADHNDPGSQALPHAHEAQCLRRRADSRSLGFVHVADDTA